LKATDARVGKRDSRPSVSRGGDWWASTAVVPDASNYTRVGTVGTMLVTGGAGRTKLVDCLILQWGDHFVARAYECAQADRAARGAGAAWGQGEGLTLAIRTLGYVFDDGLIPTTVPVYRCFDSVAKNHALSLDANCTGFGKTEFRLGYVFPAPNAV
jgi:hypothetical protein